MKNQTLVPAHQMLDTYSPKFAPILHKICFSVPLIPHLLNTKTKILEQLQTVKGVVIIDEI